jgi:hypothetical protein
MPVEEQEMRKNITTAVLAGSPVLFFDNIKRHIDSGVLDAFISSRGYRDRILGSNSDVDCTAHGITVFMTGNQCTWAADFPRRAYIANLYSPDKKRIIQNPLDHTKLLAMRSDVLSCMWSLTRSWYAAGKPAPKVQLEDNLFSEWYQMVNGILEYSGFMKLYKTKVADEIIMSKDDMIGEEQMLIDLERMVMLMKPGMYYMVQDIDKVITENNLFGWMSPEGRTRAIGIQLGRWNGRVIGNRRLIVIDNKNRGRKQYTVREVEI